MVKNLKQLRKRRGISQQQLASVLGVSQQSVNKYENHNVEPDIAILVAMADFFGTSIDYLVGHCGSMTPEISTDVITPEEKRLLANYRKLNQAERLCVETVIRSYNHLEKE